MLMSMPPGRVYSGSHNVHQLYVHLVFVTKHRQPRLYADRENEYFKIFDEICHDERLNAQLLSMGTDNDHVHLLVRFPPTVSISDLVKFLKGGFSYQWNKKHPPVEDKSEQKFHWSAGYFVKTVGQTTIGESTRYIWQQGSKKKKPLPATKAA